MLAYIIIRRKMKTEFYQKRHYRFWIHQQTIVEGKETLENFMGKKAVGYYSIKDESENCWDRKPRNVMYPQTLKKFLDTVNEDALD